MTPTQALTRINADPTAMIEVDRWTGLDRFQPKESHTRGRDGLCRTTCPNLSTCPRSLAVT